MLTDEHFDDLQKKGYTVVSDVLTNDECDKTIDQYKQWLSQFTDEGEWPFSANSLIQRYNAGHMEPTWFARLKSKRVFAQVWKTEKLLTSFDAIAIGRPPEESEEQFHRPGQHWFHVDQSAIRSGLHAYQGAVYLEAADEDDWTLHVMEGSHAHFENFFANNERARIRSENNNYYSYLDEEVIEMRKNGCREKRVAVPKGGMVLWDSRLIHANASPIKGRKHPGRWRYCVFVSMTPAIWASKNDIKEKKDAYDKACMTTHWSSQDVMIFKTAIPSYAKQDVEYPKELPDIANSREAKLISGVIPYDFNDALPNGDAYTPKWLNKKRGHETDFGKLGKLLVGVAVGLSVISLVVYKLRK
ncbi:uncharacterized protein LOC128246884 [Mya arenaria]|uniref:uncharacterized protein LOC128246884 n=1 Tax=Mya arenaria TaxID=6604 RepID=UPI0022E0CBA7|nr:uncharacterized protein LOC128246884 [Mya arenaria]